MPGEDKGKSYEKRRGKTDKKLQKGGEGKGHFQTHLGYKDQK